MLSPSDQDAKDRVEELRKQIAGPPDVRDERISDEDRDVLIEFDDQLVSDRRDANRCGWQHHRNVLYDLVDFAINTDGLAKSLDPGQRGVEGKDELTSYANEEYDDRTLQHKLSAIRVFAATVLDQAMLPSRFAKIEPSKQVEEDPAPLPSEIVEYDEILRMIKESNLLRDKALIPAQWELGPRPQKEMHVLQRQNLKIKDDVIVVTLPRTTGKTERRSLPATASMPYLRAWLENHPVWDDPNVPINRDEHTIKDIPPETYIWTHHNKNELLEYQSWADRFSEAADRAGVTKQTCPQHLRRSSASIAARQAEIGERDLRHLYDWSRFSTSPRHYIEAHSDKPMVNITRARGHEVENFSEDYDTSPLICERCAGWTMRGIDNCVHCNYDLNPEQANIDDMARPVSNPYEGDKHLSQKVIDGDVTASELEAVKKVQNDIESMGSRFFDQLDKLIDRAQRLEETKAYAGITGLGASITGQAIDTAERAVAGWIWTKHKIMATDPEYCYYPNMPRRRAAWLLVGITIGLALMGLTLELNGGLDRLAAGDLSEWGSLLIALVIGKWMIDRAMPTLDEAQEAREQEA